VTQERLRRLQETGHRFLRPPVETYAALAAARQLLAEAAAGDLAVEGQTVPPEELKTWLARHLPEALQSFLEAVVGEQVEPDQEALERLQELLQGQWILRVADVTVQLSFTEQWVASLAARYPQVIGYLAGPPGLVFLHPEGVVRA
jgi:hypothetical protein